MKVLGVGLSKTGTISLNTALRILGLKSMHHDTRRLNRVLAGSDPSPNFRIYDDLDAVTDLPAAAFYDELLQAYPQATTLLHPCFQSIQAAGQNIPHLIAQLCLWLDKGDRVSI